MKKLKYVLIAMLGSSAATSAAAAVYTVGDESWCGNLALVQYQAYNNGFSSKAVLAGLASTRRVRELGAAAEEITTTGWLLGEEHRRNAIRKLPEELFVPATMLNCKTETWYTEAIFSSPGAFEQWHLQQPERFSRAALEVQLDTDADRGDVLAWYAQYQEDAQIRREEREAQKRINREKRLDTAKQQLENVNNSIRLKEEQKQQRTKAAEQEAREKLEQMRRDYQSRQPQSN